VVLLTNTNTLRQTSCVGHKTCIEEKKAHFGGTNHSSSNKIITKESIVNNGNNKNDHIFSSKNENTLKCTISTKTKSIHKPKPTTIANISTIESSTTISKDKSHKNMNNCIGTFNINKPILSPNSLQERQHKRSMSAAGTDVEVSSTSFNTITYPNESIAEENTKKGACRSQMNRVTAANDDDGILETTNAVDDDVTTTDPSSSNGAGCSTVLSQQQALSSLRHIKNKESTEQEPTQPKILLNPTTVHHIGNRDNKKQGMHPVKNRILDDKCNYQLRPLARPFYNNDMNDGDNGHNSNNAESPMKERRNASKKLRIVVNGFSLSRSPETTNDNIDDTNDTTIQSDKKDKEEEKDIDDHNTVEDCDSSSNIVRLLTVASSSSSEDGNESKSDDNDNSSTSNWCPNEEDSVDDDENDQTKQGNNNSGSNLTVMNTKKDDGCHISLTVALPTTGADGIVASTGPNIDKKTRWQE